MKPYQIKKAAEEMGISIDSALKMRVRYLLSVMDLWPDYIENGGDIPALGIWEAFDEIVSIKLFEAQLKKPATNDITDEMIQRANDYPIEKVVEFDRSGKAMAFCHDDKTPSLSWFKKGNKAVCFPCQLIFSPIDILVKRDGMAFIQAVRGLQ